jgi:hypothetical protein
MVMGAITSQLPPAPSSQTLVTFARQNTPASVERGNLAAQAATTGAGGREIYRHHILPIWSSDQMHEIATGALSLIKVCIDLERLTKPPEQGAASKTVRLYGETLQRSYGGLVRRS